MFNRIVKITLYNYRKTFTFSLLNFFNFAGGSYKPPCKTRHRVAIIIPLRNRDMHLRRLLAHMHRIWKRQLIDYTVYAVTQSGTEHFNRGKLMNIGFAEANKGINNNECLCGD